MSQTFAGPWARVRERPATDLIFEKLSLIKVVHKVCTVLLAQTCDWSAFQNVREGQAGLTLEVWLHQSCVGRSRRESWWQASSVPTGVPSWTAGGWPQLGVSEPREDRPLRSHPARGEGLGWGIVDLGYKERAWQVPPSLEAGLVFGPCAPCPDEGRVVVWAVLWPASAPSGPHTSCELVLILWLPWSVSRRVLQSELSEKTQGQGLGVIRWVVSMDVAHPPGSLTLGFLRRESWSG